MIQSRMMQILMIVAGIVEFSQFSHRFYRCGAGGGIMHQLIQQTHGRTEVARLTLGTGQPQSRGWALGVIGRELIQQLAV